MPIEVVLLVLRVLSMLLLLTMLLALFAVMWLDYRSASNEVEAGKRKYGQIVGLQEVDGSYIMTGEVYPLLTLTSLGRAPTNSIHIEDSFASGEHAVVVMRDGQWWLEDRQSRNGTTLNGVRIDQPIIVTDGDIIGIGSNRYRLELET